MNILVHGFNVKNPKKSIGKLEPYIEDSFMFDYGWFGLWSVLRYNKREAIRLMKLIELNIGDTNVIAHSNGGAISVESARQGAVIKSLVIVNGALKSNTVFPDSIGRILVIHTNHDVPTRVARFFDKVPFIQLLIPNAWGAMGAIGSVTDDHRVTNINADDLKGHSDLFKKANIDKYARIISDWLDDE